MNAEQMERDNGDRGKNARRTLSGVDCDTDAGGEARFIFFARSAKRPARNFVGRIRTRINSELGFPRRVGKWFERQRRWFLSVITISSILALAAATGLRFSLSPQMWKVGLLFYATTSFLYSQGSARGWYYGRNAVDFVFLPISDDAIFRRIWWLHQIQLLRWFGVFGVWYGWAALSAARGDGTFAWLLAIAAALLGWLSVSSMVAIWTAFFPYRHLNHRIELALFCVSLTLLFAGHVLVEPLASSVEWLLLVLPTGWVAGAFLASVSATKVPFWIYASLVVGMIFAWPFAYRRMRRDYAIRGLNPMSSSALDSVDDQTMVFESEEEERRFHGYIVEESNRHGKVSSDSHSSLSRAFHFEERWNSMGRLERFVWGKLSRRQRMIADLLTDQPGLGWFAERSGHGAATWGQQYLKGVTCLVLLLGVVWWMPITIFSSWIAFLPLLAASMIGAPLFVGGWNGLVVPNSSLHIHSLPISYREIAGIVLLVNFLRIALWTPVLLAGSSLAAWKAGLGWNVGFQLGLKFSFLAIVIQPLTFLMMTNQDVEDRSGLFKFLTTGVVVAVALGVLGIAGIAFFQDDGWRTLLGAFGLAASAHALLILDFRRHERGILDFVDSSQGSDVEG